jgi:peptide chain release factor 1
MTIDAHVLGKLELAARRFAELETELGDPALVGDPRRYPALMRERGRLARAAELYREASSLASDREDARGLLEARDRDSQQLAREELARIEEREPLLEREIVDELVKDPELERTRVIVEIRAGTGGDEATLFARDLFEIYERFAQARKWRLETLDLSTSDVGGFREIVFGLEGDEVWNLLRFESGGHRVQRVPATEAQGRVHTSAATVAVLPEAEEVELEIDDRDLRIDTMRAGGPGGQSVNTTSSAVRITHLPTGTVVQCQDEKSQHKNKAKAMRVLRARLFDAEQQRRDAERASTRKTLVGSGDRSQRVRTYNYPQNRCSDHRLEANFSLETISAGRLGALLEALVALDRAERVKAL